jgi:hypothetical protein
MKDKSHFSYTQGVSRHAPDPTSLSDDLAGEPAVLTGALIGYSRVSPTGQLLDRQTRALTEAGCTKTFADKLSGRTTDRPELTRCLEHLWPGTPARSPGHHHPRRPSRRAWAAFRKVLVITAARASTTTSSPSTWQRRSTTVPVTVSTVSDRTGTGPRPPVRPPRGG